VAARNGQAVFEVAKRRFLTVATRPIVASIEPQQLVTDRPDAPDEGSRTGPDAADAAVKMVNDT